MVQSINRTDMRATEPLALVHCDLCGPIQPVVKDGFKYAMSFVDDYSCANTVYFLRQKCDATRATENFFWPIVLLLGKSNVCTRTMVQSLQMITSDY